MDKKKLGQEPAFATSALLSGNESVYQSGMSTRLYLAGMAMQGILAGDSTALTCTTENDVIEAHKSYKYDCTKVAKNALRFADELLKQESE